jgi:hypothetical protein
MKVEELKMYGKALEMPKEGLKKQQKVIFKTLKNEFGLIGFFILLLKAKKEVKRIESEYPDAISMIKKMGKDMDKQMTFMGGLFYAIANKRGRKEAYEIMKKVMHIVAHISMPAIYQLSDLVKCEGEVFDNYKKFNRAMFTEIDRIGTWKNSGFNETDDLLDFKVTSCINVDFYSAIGCPEVARLACEHDLAGYPLIEEAVQSEFRRPCTLATGYDYCHFHFYRKGTAPKTDYINL